jgi:DNA polymerase elongation subunit (family B)
MKGIPPHFFVLEEDARNLTPPELRGLKRAGMIGQPSVDPRRTVDYRMNPVRKIMMRYPRDTPKLRRFFSHHLEGDVLYNWRFKIDKGLYNCCKVNDRHISGNVIDLTNNEDALTPLPFDSLPITRRYLISDIEIDNRRATGGDTGYKKAIYPITSVSACDSLTKDLMFYGWHPDFTENSDYTEIFREPDRIIGAEVGRGGKLEGGKEVEGRERKLHTRLRTNPDTMMRDMIAEWRDKYQPGTHITYPIDFDISYIIINGGRTGVNAGQLSPIRNKRRYGAKVDSKNKRFAI